MYLGGGGGGGGWTKTVVSRFKIVAVLEAFMAAAWVRLYDVRVLSAPLRCLTLGKWMYDIAAVQPPKPRDNEMRCITKHSYTDPPSP